ncbi:MAG TPA: hypothetical protein VFJ17_02490 [Mycobacteriales bacterium]|jgi:hypothetical protein|nr:hypothetical protein [Mycobacteriales bacterium]
MKRSAVVVLVAALAASLSGCGDQFAGRAVDMVSTRSAVDPDTVVVSHPPSFGFADFPTWMSHTAPDVTWQSDDYVAPQPVALPDCPGGVSPHFDTPEAAMTYLASAWNRDDLADLCQVTNPNARLLLLEMHREAVNLRLSHCDKEGELGGYGCVFDHDYPKKLHKMGVGHTWVAVAPADIPGWYMTVYEGCG